MPHKERSLPVPPRRLPVLRQDAQQWRLWHEVTIKIYGLPLTTKKNEVHDIFRDEGCIVRIQLFQNGIVKRNVMALVTFSPPPQREFWTDEEWIISRESSPGKRLPVELVTPTEQQGPKGPWISEDGRSRNLTLSAISIDFGILLQPLQMMMMQTISSTYKNLVNFTVDSHRREIQIQYYLPTSEDVTNLTELDYEPNKLVFSVKSVDTIWERRLAQSGRSIIISLDQPPMFFKKNSNAKKVNGRYGSWRDDNPWTRRTDIKYPGHAQSTQPLKLQVENALIDIAAWTTYKINFDGNDSDRLKYDHLCELLEEQNIKIIRSEKFELLSRKENSVWDQLLTPRIRGTHRGSFSELKGEIYHLPWKIRYQLESCISQGCINERNISGGFLQRLQVTDSHLEDDILLRLEAVVNRKKRMFDPMRIFDPDMKLNINNQKLPKHCLVQRSATVTPTTIYYSVPAVEMSNRIIRKYSQYADRFLRVRFSDEKDQGRLHPATDGSKMAIFNRIHHCLLYGIQIGDRHFDFLASGNSQFREYGAYFFASLPHLTVDKIRSDMGNFDKIKTVSKYASRLGLCFSTTHAIHNIGRIYPREARDVEAHGYNFTDGIGKMSKSFASLIASELGLPNATHDPPSAYQFRMGGTKGVVAIDPKLTGHHEICIRESQYKFASSFNGFEVIRWSRYSVPRLNRQLITVLKALKIPDEAISRKMDFEISKLDEAMVNEVSAIQMLQSQVDYNGMTIEIARIINDGFLAHKDPFAISVLQLWRSWSLKQLKEKAGLVIQKGAFLLGCTDESVKLRGWYEDRQPPRSATYQEKVAALPQIFVQITDLSNKGHYKVIEGVCIVARNPSLHPGDIRVVHAVNILELHHLRDVVVFPQVGDRDIPSMCSGGDLDGDDFVVIWDEDLIPPPEKWDVPAMDFSSPEPEKVEHITIEDVCDFFVKYMENDTLRTIARFHLANADYFPDGVENPRCRQLAHQHSIAVDFSKSGHAPDPVGILAPRIWPHFMGNEYRQKDKEYHSRTILGQLYDMIPDYDFRPLLDSPFNQRIITAYDHTSEQIKVVGDLKLAYDTALRRLMAQHEIKSEFEVWSTLVLNHSRAENDYKFHEVIGRASSVLKEQYTEIIYEHAGGKELDLVAPWVSAMYAITARDASMAIKQLKRTYAYQVKKEDARAIDPSKLPLISFPWIFHKVLGEIAADGRSSFRANTHKPQTPSKTKVKRQINIMDEPIDDIIVTTEGIVHEGEELTMFEHQNSREGDVFEKGTGVSNDSQEMQNSQQGGRDLQNHEIKLIDDQIPRSRHGHGTLNSGSTNGDLLKDILSTHSNGTSKIRNSAVASANDLEGVTYLENINTSDSRAIMVDGILTPSSGSGTESTYIEGANNEGDTSDSKGRTMTTDTIYNDSQRRPMSVTHTSKDLDQDTDEFSTEGCGEGGEEEIEQVFIDLDLNGRSNADKLETIMNRSK